MADAAPKKRKPRNRDLGDAEVFGDFTPRRNPAAVKSYAFSLYGLVPVLGLILGPIAIVLGILGHRRHRRDPSIKGRNFAAAGIIIGSLTVVTNVAGIACIGHGMGWW